MYNFTIFFPYQSYYIDFEIWTNDWIGIKGEINSLKLGHLVISTNEKSPDEQRWAIINWQILDFCPKS